MPETSDDFDSDRVVIHIDAGRPIAVDELQESLAAIVRLYDRQHLPSDPFGPPTKLYVTRISSGSPIHIEIVPLLALLGMPIAVMDSALIVRDFAEWLGLRLRSLSNAELPEDVGPEDASDLARFIEPMTGRAGAKLGIAHARFQKTRMDGDRYEEVFAEYWMNDNEINRAAVNMTKLSDPERQSAAPKSTTVREVLMTFQQADKTPGKERGRTGDRVIITSVTSKPLPVYFPSEASTIKRRILDQTENPFSKAYIVDAIVEYVGDVPKLYRVIELHEIVDLD